MRKIFLSLSIALLTAAAALAQSVLITTNTNGLNAVPYSILQLDPADVTLSNLPVLNATGGVIRAAGRAVLHFNVNASTVTALWWINAGTGTVNTALNWLGHSAADFATAEQGGKADSLSATWTNYSPASFITPPGDANSYVWQNGWTQFSISGVAYREDNVSEFANDAGYLSIVSAENLNTTNSPQVNTVLTYTAAGMAWLAATTNQPPPSTITVGFTASPTNGYASLVVTFTNTSVATGCNITNAVWDFGDGSSTTDLSVSVTHAYPVAGTNTVTLSEWTDTGLTANLVLTNLITVSAVPTPTGADLICGSGYATAPTCPLDGAATFTMEAWIYPTSYGSPEGCYLSTRNAMSGSPNGFHTVTWSDGKLAFYDNTLGGWYFSGGTIPLNAWSHVAWTYDGASLICWINGVADSTNSTSGLLTVSGAPLFFGTDAGQSHPFTGSIVGVRLSTNVLFTSTFSTNGCLEAITDSTVGLWKMQEGTGSTLVDSSGFGDDATIYGLTWDTNGVCQAAPPPTPSYALEFDGSGSTYVTVPYDAALIPATVTIDAWIKPTVGNTYAGVISQHSSGSDEGGYRILYSMGEGTGIPHGCVSAGGNAYFVAATTDCALDGLWHEVRLTYDGTTLQIFVDGNLEGSNTVGVAVTDNGSTTIIGGDSNSTLAMTGAVSEVRISNIVLDGGGNFTPLHCLGSDSNTVGYWKLNEGTGSTAVDSSGNGHDGALSSPPPTYITPGICP